MIFLSIGLPSRFAEACDAVAAQLVADSLGSVEVINGNTLDEIASSAIRSTGSHFVVGARQPTEKLRAVLEATNTRFLLALDDPRLALHNLVAAHGMDWKAATRATASSCAFIMACAETAPARLLRADREGREPGQMAAFIGEALNLSISTERARVYEQILSDARLPAARQEFEAWWETVAPEDRVIAGDALGGYVDFFAGGRLSELTWSRELLYLGDAPHGPVGRVVELAGGVRNLAFGPYIALPAGRWSATVSLAVSQEAGDIGFSVEMLAGPQCLSLASVTTAPDARGVCLAALQFGIDRATAQPIAVRVANLRAATAGRIAFGRVILSRLSDAPVGMTAELTAAFDP